MKTTTIDFQENTEGGAGPPEKNSLKWFLTGEGALTGEKLFRKLLEVLRAKDESRDNKALAVHYLGNFPSPEAEKELLHVITAGETDLSASALKTLAAIGTEKAFKALSGLRQMAFKTLERQKDFAMLIIACRLQLPEAEEIFKRLMRETPEIKNPREIPLRFKPVSERELTHLLKKFRGINYGVTASHKMGFTVQAGERTLYFFFNSLLEDPTRWKTVVKSGIMAGYLLIQEHNSDFLTHRYLAVVTPNGDQGQFSLFRTNGELFLTADVIFDEQKGTVLIANQKGRQPKGEKETVQWTGEKNLFEIHLSLFHSPKKNNTVSADRK